MKQILMGIDPGYDRIGVAVIEKENGKEKLIFSTCITTNKKSSSELRLETIANELELIAKKFKPEVCGIESLFLFKNQKTIIGVAEARGVIKLILSQSKISIQEITPIQVKNALTGNGRAEKSQVEYMVRNILNIGKDVKMLDDEIDAIAIALATASFFKKV
jgi:crossover junction endodeoxyribonuclease RuvC